MTTAPYFRGFLTLRHMIELGVSGLMHSLASPKLGRWRQRRLGAHPAQDHAQLHFGALDDQLLDDLGLQRSEIRAAEYGILPGNQALHHEDETRAPADNTGARCQT